MRTDRTGTFKTIYDHLGLLMAALINDPKNVTYVYTTSSTLYHAMVLFLRHWSEIGHQVVWVQMRITYIRDIMEAAHACLRSQLPFEVYIESSRSYMDLCSRGGVPSSQPPSFF